jgi:uncharacterized protein YacL
LTRRVFGFLQFAVNQKLAAIGRLMFVLVATMTGCYVGLPTRNAIPFSLIGFALAVLMVLIERATGLASSKKIFFAAMGATVGLIFSSLFLQAIPVNIRESPGFLHGAAPLISHMFFGYLGVALAMRHVDRFSFARLNFILAPTMEAEKVLDTSMLIDGRILEVSQTNFLPGPFVVPSFVVDELQALADNPDPIKRERGLRGLACLEDLLNSSVRARLLDDRGGSDNRVPVDRRLIALCRETNALLMTVDFGLQKVAQINQVRALNLNELANMLKSPTFVGDDLSVYLIREGKEPGQGVGFLDDGTMVVVDGGRRYLGGDVVAEVTSVIQTSTGRMVFARFKELGLRPSSEPADWREDSSEAAGPSTPAPVSPGNGAGSGGRHYRPHRRRNGQSSGGRPRQQGKPPKDSPL